MILDTKLSSLVESQTVAVNDLSNELIANGQQVVKLGLGQSPFPVPQKVREALERHAHEKDYLPVLGLKSLREKIAAYHRERDGLEVHWENVSVAPGSKELMFHWQLCLPGELLLSAPSWVSYGPQAQIAGRKISWIQSRREAKWRLQAEDLENALKGRPQTPRTLILNSPSNPTGQSHSEEELRALAEVCRRHKIWVISDEIYGEIEHQGKHRSLAAFYPEGCVLSSGISKWCGAGGWRLGYFVFPNTLKPLQEAMRIVASESFTSVAAPIQYASVTAFERDAEMKAYLQNSRHVLKTLGQHCAEVLKHGGYDVDAPQGGFYLLPSVALHAQGLQQRGIQNIENFCTTLLKETGVATLPGTAFGHDAERWTLRLAYVDFDGRAALEEASTGEISPDVLARFAPKVLQAMRAMVEFLDAPTG